MKKDLKQIAIVGMGPGDPSYLTLRAIEYINNADIVLYDCLVDEISLSIIPSHVKQERVEKKFKKHNSIDILDQEILKKLTEYADKGLQIVRIKPGDSMNYNSGGMEADYLTSNGYNVELVPGIPTHISAANLGYINLTEINQSNGLMSFMADELEKDDRLIPHIAALMKYGNIPVCLYGMRAETFLKIKTLLKREGICGKIPVTICGDISLKTQKIIATNLNDCNDVADILTNQDKMPKHYIVIIGKYIQQNYIVFKNESSKIEVCSCEK